MVILSYYSRYRGPNIEVDDRECSPTADDDVEMDDNIAAMVLTSLSCSPVSPHFPVSLTGKYTCVQGTGLDRWGLGSSERGAWC